jgi:hypothetical protein
MLAGADYRNESKIPKLDLAWCSAWADRVPISERPHSMATIGRFPRPAARTVLQRHVMLAAARFGAPATSLRNPEIPGRIHLSAKTRTDFWKRNFAASWSR